MADKLMIILANSDPDSALSIVPPLTQAATAAAMELEAEVIFTGHCARLVVPGVAERVKVGDGRTVHDVIRETAAAGVRLKVCVLGLESGAELIPEVEESVGSTYIISEAMDDDTVTFTY